MEEWCSVEVLRRDEAINTLKGEVETLSSEKDGLMIELVELRGLKASSEGALGKLQSAEKDLELAKTEAFVLQERLNKANDANEHLCSEIETERTSMTAL